jgi:uncharacterized protein YraI
MRLLTFILTLLALTACSLGSSDNETEDTLFSGPPVVTIASGIDSAPYRVGVDINIQAAVSNAGPDVVQVAFIVNNALVNTQDAPNPNDAATFNVAHTWQANAAGTYTIQVSATRADGARGDDSVSITVIDGNSSPINPVQQVTNTPLSAATNPLARSTQPSAATVAPVASSTPSVPEAVFARNQNVRTGPGTNFDRIGTFAPGDRAEILSLNLDETWYKVRFQDGQAWVYAPLTTLEGSVGGLSREAGPPTPVPPPTAVPTAVLPTVTSPPGVNLAIEGFTISVPSDGSFQPKCGVPFVARFTIRNTGEGTTNTGAILIENVHLGSNTVNGSSQNALLPVELGPGGTHTVETALTIDTFFGEEQRVIFRVDANNQIAETNENDNQNGITYVLEQAGCG